MKSILNDLEKVKEAAKLKSTKEALEFLGLRAAGGNYAAFKKACKKAGVSQPIGTGHYQIQKAINTIRIPLENILIKNSTYSNRQTIKKRCIEAGLLENRCYGLNCNITTTWLNKKITLQLEHKNGISNDNRIENLELLCPNCHSQTETFCGRKRPRICIECGKTKQTLSPLCRSCGAKKRNPSSAN